MRRPALIAAIAATLSCNGGGETTGPQPAKPDKPTGVTATPGPCGSTGITLRWLASSRASIYHMHRDGILRDSVTGTSWMDTGLSANSVHTYAVDAANSAGTSDTASVPARAASTCPPTLILTATPASIAAGDSSTVKVASTNAEVCTDLTDNASIPLSGGVGRFVVKPTATTTYSVQCSGQGGSVTKSITITVGGVPMISVTAFEANLGGLPLPAQGVKATLTSGGLVNVETTLGQSASGTIALSSSLQALFTDSVCVTTEAVNTTQRLYIPATLCVPKADVFTASFSFTLSRLTYTVPSGTYANTTVPFVIEKATEISGDGVLSFYRFGPAFGLDTMSNWPSFPVPIAINPVQSTGTVPDSARTALWNELNAMEQRYGMDLWRQGTWGVDVTGNSGGAVTLDSTLFAYAVGGPTQIRDFYQFTAGIVAFRLVEGFFNQSTIDHEFGHLLGEGHNCAWVTIMYTNCANSQNSPVATAFDVAYFQAQLAATRTQLTTDSRCALGCSRRGEREVLGIAANASRAEFASMMAALIRARRDMKESVTQPGTFTVAPIKMGMPMTFPRK